MEINEDEHNCSHFFFTCYKGAFFIFYNSVTSIPLFNKTGLNKSFFILLFLLILVFYVTFAQFK